MRQPQEVEGLQTKMRWRRNVKSSLLIMDFFFFCEEFIVSDERTCSVPCKFECLSDVLASFFNKSLKEQRPKKNLICAKKERTQILLVSIWLYSIQKYPHEGIISYDYS